MRAALIGAGQIARQHLSCLQTVPGVEVAVAHGTGGMLSTGATLVLAKEPR